MLNEASLMRLAEMGIDVYVPRASRTKAIDTGENSTAAASRAASAAVAASSPRLPSNIASARVVLVADADSASKHALLGDIVRALKFAHIESVRCDVHDEAALTSANGLVLFGDACVRAVGAALPASRQREVGWVATVHLELLSSDVHAKRALWSELKRLARSLANDGSTGAQTPAAARGEITAAPAATSIHG